MTVTIQQVEAYLEEGLQFAQKVAPFLTLVGPAGAAAGAAINTIATLGETLLTEVEGDISIIASGNLDQIKQLQAALQTENAQLNADVQTS